MAGVVFGAPAVPDRPRSATLAVVRSAYSVSLDALARRDRSVQELSRWLRERGYAADDIGNAVTRLIEGGLLNDVRYAESFARTRLAARKLSRRRVSMELVRRGVAREVADAAIGAVVADEGIDETAAITAVAERKFRTMSGLAPEVAARRLTGFLARRGYDSAAVRAVVERLAGR